MNEFTQVPVEAVTGRRIYVAGHQGMVGEAIVRRLESLGCDKLITASRSKVDLTRQAAVEDFFRTARPEWVFVAAARVGGINANNSYPAQFIYENLAIEINLIRAAHENGVSRLLFLGSSCVYPRLALQPMAEDALLSGPLEATNEPYAIAKIAGIKLCESFNREFGTDYRSVMPTNLYGPNDNFDLSDSHVVPALIRKFHEGKVHGSKSVEIWGTGAPRREFLFVDDLADACVFVMRLTRDTYNSVTEPMKSHINIGSGKDITIAELAVLTQDIVAYSGKIAFNPDYPDGTPRKLLDVSIMNELGWGPSTSLREGLTKTYRWYLDAETS